MGRVIMNEQLRAFEPVLTKHLTPAPERISSHISNPCAGLFSFSFFMFFFTCVPAPPFFPFARRLCNGKNIPFVGSDAIKLLGATAGAKRARNTSGMLAPARTHAHQHTRRRRGTFARQPHAVRALQMGSRHVEEPQSQSSADGVRPATKMLTETKKSNNAVRSFFLLFYLNYYLINATGSSDFAFSFKRCVTNRTHLTL